MIKLNEGGKFHIAIQLCCGCPDDGDYIIVKTYSTKHERDYAFDHAGETGL